MVRGLTYFSQHLGASSTKRSIVMSPSDVSRSTDIVVVCAYNVRCTDRRCRDKVADARTRLLEVDA
jgi:hypothetical protein